MSQSAVLAGRAFVEVFADDTKLRRALDGAAKKLQTFGAATFSIGWKVAAAGTAMASPFVLAGKIWADAGSEMIDLADRTGIGVEALSALTYAAGQSGASAEDLEIGVKKMQQTLADAAGGSSDAQGKLAALGLSLTDLQQMATDEQFAALADKIAAIPDPANRTAAALDLFGKSGTKLLPLMKDGAAGIKEMTDKARELGLVMSTEDAAAAEAFGDQVQTVGDIVKRLAFNVGAALAPLLKEIADRMIVVASAAAKWIKENAGLVRMAAIAVGVVIALGAGIALLGGILTVAGFVVSAFSALLFAIPTVVGLIVSAVTAAAGVIAAVFAFMISPLGILLMVLGGLIYWFVDLKAVASSVGGYLKGVWDGVKKDAVDAFGAIAAALAAGNIQAAAAVLWAYLKLLWAQGTAWIGGVWDATLTGFLQYFADICTGLQGVWIAVCSFLEQTWVYLTTGLQGAWINLSSVIQAYAMTIWQFVVAAMMGTGAALGSVGKHLLNVFVEAYNLIVGVVRGLANFVLTIIGGLSVAFGGVFTGLTKQVGDLHKATNNALAPMERFNAGNPLAEFGKAFDAAGAKSFGDNLAATGGVAALQRNQEERAARLAGIRGDAAARQQDLTASANQASADRQNALNARDNARTASVDDARAAFRSAIDDASKAANAAQQKQAGAAKKGAQGAGGDDVAGKLTTLGTFSGAAAGMLGGGGPAERTAKATEDTAKNTRRIMTQQSGQLKFT